MQQIYIPVERLKTLRGDKKLIGSFEKATRCRISLTAGDCIEATSRNDDAYDEFLAKNVISAYGRGFEPHVAELLLRDDYYFSSIDLGREFGNSKRLQHVKARIIGKEGKAKTYIEGVSGVKISVYGDTVSFIGSAEQIEEAEAAVNTLIDGSTHKLAYARMEAAHRKHKEKAHDIAF